MTHAVIRRHRIGSLSVAICLLSMLVLCGLDNADAQQPTKVPRIGYLTAVALTAYTTRIEAFRQGLREHGYVEGKNIFVEWRSSEGMGERTAALEAELVHLKAEVLVSGGLGTTRAAMEGKL